MAQDVPAMIQGLGTAMRLISTLSADIKEVGGNDEMLHFLATDYGQENRKAIAQFIVRLKFRVPKSRIMKLAKESSIKENGRQSEFVASDEAFWWTPVLQDLGIPYRTFAKGSDRRPEDENLNELVKLLQGQKAEAGMQIFWRGRMYVLCYLGYENGTPAVGDTIDMNNVDRICLMPSDRIDLEA